MRTIACVLRSGGQYDAEHVHRLRDILVGQADCFVCLTDMDVNCDSVRMTTHWPSWWSKLELFYHFTGPTLYLDLDNIVVDQVKSLFRETYGLTMVQDFYKPTGLNSSVMAWCGDFSHISDTFAAHADSYMKSYRRTHDGRIGDQAFIEDHTPADRFEDGAVVSYKKHCPHGVLPTGARVVQFHGKPKYTDVNHGWIYK